MKKFDLAHIVELYVGVMLKEEIGSSKFQMDSPTLIIPMVNRHRIAIDVEEKLERLPRTLQFLYLQTRRIVIQWNIKPGSTEFMDIWNEDLLKDEYTTDRVSGLVNILSLNDMFDAENEEFYGYNLATRLNENLDGFYPFDFCYNLIAFLKKENDLIQDRIYLLNRETNEVFDMKVSAEQYLELVYKAKGFYHWQLVFLFKEKAANYELMKKYLPKILAHVDYDLQEFGIN